MGESNAPFRSEPISSWRQLQQLYADRAWSEERWIFRGQGDSTWPLSSSLERLLVNRLQLGLGSAPVWEARLQREFSRHTYQLEGGDPAAGQLDEWWALMRHHGAPTRLLDWTYSFWVATFFALENAAVGETCAIWVLDRTWARDRIRERVTPEVRDLLAADKRAPATLADLFVEQSERFVTTINPLRFNQRHALQQGVFLVPGCVTESLMENVRAVVPEDDGDHCVRVEIRCDSEVLREGLSELMRMNLSRATLFPGLDGFGAHMANLVLAPARFRGVRFEPPFDELGEPSP